MHTHRLTYRDRLTPTTARAVEEETAHIVPMSCQEADRDRLGAYIAGDLPAEQLRAGDWDLVDRIARNVNTTTGAARGDR
jgi:hypothetical protein